MEYGLNVSSEEELLKLREEGKISQREYEELLGAMKKPPAGRGPAKPPGEPQFQAFRRRIMIGGFVISVLGVIFGLILKLPLVWGLGILGIIVVPLKYYLTNKNRQCRADS
ncbi:MAG: hypothetical protein P8Z79_25385 [Sedimentisphaerales bacterium]|jgi:hypothetical protein